MSNLLEKYTDLVDAIEKGKTIEDITLTKVDGKVIENREKEYNSVSDIECEQLYMLNVNFCYITLTNGTILPHGISFTLTKDELLQLINTIVVNKITIKEDVIEQNVLTKVITLCKNILSSIYKAFK